MASTIDGFLPSWRHSRQLTLDFIAAVPDARWDWSPHPRYATLAKQFRHVLCVHGTQKLGSYLNAFLHHEALHHGQWSFYATLGGFETPMSWKVNWGL